MSNTSTPAGTKPWYASVTIWGSIIAIAAPLAGAVFHHDIDASTQSDLANWLAGAGTLVGGGIAIWGRLRARTTIGPKS
jgi:hypothetical protein